MPKVPKAKKVVCVECSKSFVSPRALTLHLFHKQTTCGRNNRLSIKQPPTCFSIIESDTEDDNEHDDQFATENHDDILSVPNMPFELSPGKLLSIPGEVNIVPHSTEQRVHVELLQLLDHAEAPDYLFQEVIEWASRAKAMQYNFSPVLTSRSAVVNDLQQYFNMQNLRPTISQLKLESVTPLVPIVSFDFTNLLVSLLTDNKLMQPDNLVINKAIQLPDGSVDVSPWFSPYVAADGHLHEVLSGQWYRDTVELYAGDPNVFVCPLIGYIDQTFIDPMKSRFTLQPLNLTLAIFNRQSRSQFSFWRTLGFVPEHPFTDQKPQQHGYKNRNYHLMLHALLSGLIDIHKHPEKLNNFHLRIGNHVKLVNLRVPVAFFIADTQGADKLCGRYLVYKDTVSRLHRACLCQPENAADTDQQCEWVTMERMMEAIDSEDKDVLAELSQHLIPDHAFRNIDFGSNPHGIYGATPNDILHGLKLGIISYVLENFMASELSSGIRHALDNALFETLPHLKQGGNKSYPRLYFPNGITTLTQTTADECLGILFITYVLCSTSQGRKAVTDNSKVSIARLNVFLKIFERLLIFHAWMCSKDGFWIPGDTRARNRALRSIKSLMNLITENLTRDSAQGWNISKMHELLHITHFIDMFGSPTNFDSASCERMHKDVAKKPGRKSQKRHETFTMQAASRLADRYVIDRAYHEIVGDDERTGDDNDIPVVGSSFDIVVASADEDNHVAGPNYQVSVRGFRNLSGRLSQENLYPNLVEYIVAYFAEYYEDVPGTIQCCTEMADDDGKLYRAHPDYRGAGFWHDWALVSYQRNSADEGYDNVPAKLLCFLPNGLPDDEQCHVVCHPCRWQKQVLSPILTRWSLQPCSDAAINDIPYDIVPMSSLFSHCLMIPDLVLPGVVYEVLEKDLWWRHFVAGRW